MKRIAAFAFAAFAAAQISAAPAARGGRAAAAAQAPQEESTKVTIERMPNLGKNSLFASPSGMSGQSAIGKCYTRPRHWIVLEAKYQTYTTCEERLTFTWHVILDSKTATVNKNNKEGLPQYSYFTASTTYINIPQGRHAACVCLHPSYVERYGEPKAVGLVITDAKGETVTFQCDSQIQGIGSKSSSNADVKEAFWNDNDIMEAKDKAGQPMIERREGLRDRSKTIWATVNSDDYELVEQ